MDSDKTQYQKSFKTTVKNILKSITGRINYFAESSWRGAAIGAILAMFIHLFIIGSFFKTGISPVLDWSLIFFLSCLIIFATGMLAKPLFSIIREFNPWFVAALASTLLVSQFMPLKVFGQNLILIEIVCGALAGFALSTGIKKPLSLILIIISAGVNILILIGLSSEGTDTSAPLSDKFWNQKQIAANVINSSSDLFNLNNKTKLKVNTLFYGSGTDKQRKEYGANVTIKTRSVDAVPFFDQTSGFANKMRELFWGFNSKNYPLNARVWYPQVDSASPLVIIVHGNHNMYDYSDPGYEYLGKYLAERGYIVASVDENFLNGGWMGDYNQSEIFIRAWLLLKHLELWREWNGKENNPFYHKVDINNIVLIGHSRGGAAAALASVINNQKKYHLDAKKEFNFGFSIKGVVQIAPNDPYNPQNEIPLTLENIDYLILQGGHDQDLSWFMGNRVYNRLKFTDSSYHFKSAVYIYKANHGQFNSVWGRTDYSAPLSWFTNQEPIMPQKDQQKIAKLFILSFLEASTRKRSEYLPLLKDFRFGREILPRDYYISQFEDSRFRYLADYQEDFDVTTSSVKKAAIEGHNLAVWSENALSFRDDFNSSQHNCGVYLGWDKKDSTLKGISEYSLNFHQGTVPDNINNFLFFLCSNKDDIPEVDFNIQFTAGTQIVVIPFSEIRVLPPPLKSKLSKWSSIHSISGNDKAERVLQLTEIPFSELTRKNHNFNISELNSIKFIFDRTDKGEIFLDKIGYN